MKKEILATKSDCLFALAGLLIARGLVFEESLDSSQRGQYS
jgi:hypothetical protein